ncbi:hypothetical protein A2V71_02420 [Candidatus Berkelbacteria bacterium RBG_13_40_8]|uniref:Homing endonuclease LAGLIDADG domain-containing protein n=1 Tax=Candidatus Berkelbacteria bacterium RBG_13_40_8 TaxID=1797467 RepID=A0A1F5DNB9_9BACT|nr:MAG: hypothetical protein A2V71_02420 [Candidatus Berkelbacteria bacterium RBG_13_40_8]
MGSRPNIENLAYIAGFLDGDGSLMLQVKKRSDTSRGWRMMATICFYQDSRHSKPLNWIKKQLKIGYISNRNDGITELRINGFEKVEKILKMLSPFIKFKKNQVQTVLKAIKLMQEKDFSDFKTLDYKKLIKFLLDVQNENYQSSHKKTGQNLEKIFGLTP